MKDFLSNWRKTQLQFVFTILLLVFVTPPVLMSSIAIGVRLTCLISPHSHICGGR